MTLLEVGKWKYVGVDGCKGGWFCVGFDGGGDYGFKVFGKFKDLLNAVANAELVLVDMPIGLPDGADERKCDRLARKKLRKPRSSSVFRVPIRKAVEKAASGPNSRAAASNVQFQTTGTKISPWTFGIIPKIAEVNNELEDRDSGPQVREVHPELCFWALNRESAMKRKKSTIGGQEERLCVLERDDVECRSRQIHLDARRSCKDLEDAVDDEDILDALVAAVTARRGHGQLTCIPDPLPKDSVGQMVYWQP